MSGSSERRGGCLCGGVRIRAPRVDEKVGACHCGMCRKWGGGPLLAVDCGTEVQFEGEENIRVFASSDWAERGFCATCGSHLFYRLKQSGQYIVPAGLFDDQAGFTFDHQVFVDRKPTFYSFAQRTTEMTEAEVFARYGSPAD